MQHDERLDVAALTKGRVHPLPGLADAVIDIVAAAAPLPVSARVGVQGRLQFALLLFALALALLLLLAGRCCRSQGGCVLRAQGAARTT